MHTILAYQDLTNQPVQFSLNTTIGQIITWIIIGIVAGLLASILVRGRGLSLTGSIIVGLIGAVLGGIIFGALGVEPVGVFGGEIVIRWIDVVAAFIGAVIILFIASLFYRRRRL